MALEKRALVDVQVPIGDADTVRVANSGSQLPGARRPEEAFARLSVRSRSLVKRHSRTLGQASVLSPERLRRPSRLLDAIQQRAEMGDLSLNVWVRISSCRGHPTEIPTM